MRILKLCSFRCIVNISNIFLRKRKYKNSFLKFKDLRKFFSNSITQDHLQEWFLLQYSFATQLRHYFEQLQHCSNIATLCCAKYCCCELSCVTSPLQVDLLPENKQQMGMLEVTRTAVFAFVRNQMLPGFCSQRIALSRN